MSAALEKVFTSYSSTPLDADCYKTLLTLLGVCTQAERDLFFKSCQPTELHLQLLKIAAAHSTRHYDTLLLGLQDESKSVSKHCVDSKFLYCRESRLYDSQFLLPLLQVVSRSTRNRLIWNIGKYLPSDNGNVADTLFNSIGGIWGFTAAIPLLCKASEKLLEQELPNVTTLSKFQLLNIANRFPHLALTYVEQHSARPYPVKAVRYIVRKTMPQSFDYCLKNPYALSKSTMKLILRNYSNIVMEAPTEWALVLDVLCVKKILSPEHFQLFVSKQCIMEIKQSTISYILLAAFKLLPASQVSLILKQVFQSRYSCALDGKLDIWKVNGELLKLLAGEDRDVIAMQLNETSKDSRWVPYMTSEKAIAKLKDQLRNEANAHNRASLVKRLLETTVINKDSKALEEVCKFIAVRYRNDRDVLQTFFDSLPDLSSISTETWTVVFELADKICSSQDLHIYSAHKLIPTLITRRGKPGLKTFLARVMKSNSNYNLQVGDLATLPYDMRNDCIDMVFTEDNIKNSDLASFLLQFLCIISEWNKDSTQPMVFPCVEPFLCSILNESGWNTSQVIDFVSNKHNGLPITFIAKCFQIVPVPKLIWIILRSKKMQNLINDDIATKIVDHALKRPLFGSGYISLIQYLTKKGYVKPLQTMQKICCTKITETDRDKFNDVILLLCLTTANVEEYYSITDPFLPEIDEQPSNLKEESSGDGNDYEKLQRISRRDSKYKGIGSSLSFIDPPRTTIDRLLRLCVNGDLLIFVRDSLYSVCSSLPNEAAYKIIATLVNRPVSVKKHALRLQAAVSNIEMQQKFFAQLMETETHMTARTVLLQSAISCLNNSKSSAVWQLTKEMLMRLTPNDQSIIVLLKDATVPKQFVEEYFQLLLEKSESLEKVTIDIVSSILSMIYFNCDAMSDQFLESLMRKYFLSERFLNAEDSHESVNNLFYAYLIGNENSSPLETRQRFLKEMLSTTVTEASLYAYCNLRLGLYPIRKLFKSFVQSFCSRWLHQEKTVGTDLNLFTDIIFGFLGQFKQNLMFNPYVTLTVTQLIKIDDPSKTFGFKIAEFCDETYKNNPELSMCFLPTLLLTYFREVGVSLYNTDEFREMLLEILPSAPCSDSLSLFRLMVVMVVGQCTSPDWHSDLDHLAVRQQFMTLSKNTIFEVVQ